MLFPSPGAFPEGLFEAGYPISTREIVINVSKPVLAAFPEVPLGGLIVALRKSDFAQPPEAIAYSPQVADFLAYKQTLLIPAAGFLIVSRSLRHKTQRVHRERGGPSVAQRFKNGEAFV
jgi:hypothetical protein